MLDLDAGKYAAFLWPAYGISAAVLLWLVVDTIVRARAARAAARAHGLEDDWA